MLIVLTTLHIFVSFFLIIVVLLQSGKAADLAGAFGGMGSQTAFGPRGAATVLTKATTTAAVLFMLTSITLGVTQGRFISSGQSVIDRTGATTETEVEQDSTTGTSEQAPAAPATAPAATDSEDQQ